MDLCMVGDHNNPRNPPHHQVRQLKFDQPGLDATLLKPTNECGVEKLICTFVKVILSGFLQFIFVFVQFIFVFHQFIFVFLQVIFVFVFKPTVLPYSHLFDVDACAKFVSDFVYYNPDR